MASEEHIQLAQFLKSVHTSLREQCSSVGAEKAWQDHCKNEETLNTYALYMEKLATTHWKDNCSDGLNLATSRIEWAATFCKDYFTTKTYNCYSKKEIEIGNKIHIEIENDASFTEPITLLDVGSCYNPFKDYKLFDVLAIDLCPANDSVLQCDFLNVTIDSDTIVNNNTVQMLKKNSFDIVTFCFLLEYIPSSDLRIKACENAYNLLNPGGLLVICTPDSKHVGANSKLIKCWRYTLACIGFSRIKYEKFKHMHCMAFRKALHKEVAVRWAILHKEPYMDFQIQIPQDFKIYKREGNYSLKIEASVEDFTELPLSFE